MSLPAVSRRFESRRIVCGCTAAIDRIKIPCQRDNLHARLQRQLQIRLGLQQLCTFDGQKCRRLPLCLRFEKIRGTGTMPQAGTAGSERTPRRIQHACEPPMRVLLRHNRLIPAKQSEYLRILPQKICAPQIYMSGVLQQIFSRRQSLLKIRQTVNGVTVQIKISQSIHLKCIGNVPNTARTALPTDNNFYDIEPRLQCCRMLLQPALRGLNHRSRLRAVTASRGAPHCSPEQGFDFRKNQ